MRKAIESKSSTDTALDRGFLIAEAVGNEIGPYFTELDVLNRVDVLTIREGLEVVRLDGKPILRLFPPKVLAELQCCSGSHCVVYCMKYQMLNPRHMDTKK